MENRINQPELSYSCGSGEAKVNLATGRLIFSYFDQSIGIDNYKIGLTHIYNSQMPTSINTFIGTNWKLNIQHYLYLENGKYIYIDGVGNKHEFLLLNGNKYYDSSGLGLTLTIEDGTFKITDGAGNIMEFQSGRLVKTVSTYNETDLITKYFNYDTSGRLTSVYDGRTYQNKFILTYDSSTNLLKSIKCMKSSIVIEEINYFYNYEKCLLQINITADGVTKIDSLFSYTQNNLNQATFLEDKSTLRFTIPNGKVTTVRSGIAAFTESTKTEQFLFTGDDIYCGDEVYLGEKQNVKSYSNNGGAQILGTDQISQNNIVYNSKNTIVTNEKAIKMIYFLNEKGMLTSIFEASESSDYHLRSLQKLPGVMMLNEGSDQYYINGERSYLLSTLDTISTTGWMSTKFDEMKTYRKNKCTNYINYTCSFFIKMQEEIKNIKFKVIIKSKESSGPIKEDFSYGSFDSSAYGSWEYISIPITISNKEIESIEIKLVDLNDNQTTINKPYSICDMRLAYSPNSRVYLTNGVDQSLLDDVSSIKYTNTLNETYSINLTNGLYISPLDIETTYLSRFKSGGFVDTGFNFVLSYCDGTKKLAVNRVTLCVTKGGYKEYTLDFINIDYQKVGRVKVFREFNSPDGNLTTSSYTHYYKNKLIDTKSYDCIGEIIEAKRYNVETQDYTSTSTEVFIDFKGRLLQEVDEYGVETIYLYDLYGNETKKTIQNPANLSEKLIFTSNSSPVYNGSTDYKSEISSYYHDPLGNLESVKYRGKAESVNNTLTTDYSYDRFNSRLISITNNLGCGNYLNYCNKGLLEATPIGWKSDKAYGYKFGYNELGDPNKYYLSYKNGSNWGEDLLVEKDVNRSLGTVTTKQYRNATPDITTVELDKYGKTTKVTEDGKVTTFTRQVLPESSGASEVIKIVDPFENKSYNYSYDDSNNLTGYAVKKQDGSIDYEVKADGVDKIKYLGVSLSPDRFVETEIIKDKEKLINSRLTKTKTNYSAFVNDTSYSYDYLGRLINKVTLPLGSSSTKFTENIIYKPNTLLKQEIKNKIDFSSATDIDFNFYNGYDSRGNLVLNELQQINGTDSPITTASTFSYDIANRLVLETNTALGITNKSYTYNLDGSINTESEGSLTKTYVYQKGRLDYYYDNTEGGNTTYFAYDNLGNCTHYMRIPTASPNMKWCRGHLLKEYNGITTTTYSYNSEGVRFRKEQSNGKVTSYYLDGAKVLGEYHNDGNEITYLYDTSGIKGFVEWNNGNTYHYIKDVMGNVVSIVSSSKEVAHYEYDAWGNCTITKDINGVGSLNPFRWKSHYFDSESGLYLIPTPSGSRYYSPIMKSFISACNIDEILYNISIPGNLNAYSIGNPMYFPMNRFNIFTSIPLVPENIGSSSWLVKFWQDVWDWGNTIFGIINPVSKFTGIAAVTVALFSESGRAGLKEDWNNGALNPFNQSEDIARKAKVLGFYKGSTVVNQNIVSTCSMFGTIWLKGTNSVTTIKHEWGHSVQERILGISSYAIGIAIPSMINHEIDPPNYYSYPWERTADWLGGVSEGERRMASSNIGYDDNSLFWGILYLIYFGLLPI